MVFGRTRLLFVFLLAMTAASLFLFVSSPEKSATAPEPPLHTFVSRQFLHQSVLEEETIRKLPADPFYSLLPPPNSTPRDRMRWMKNNVGKFQIFKSDNLTEKFNTRVLKFSGGNKCSVRFFMTWIAAASDFGEQQLFGIDSLFKSNPKACLVIVSKTLEDSELLKPYRNRDFKITAISPDLSFLFGKTKAHRWFEQLKKGTVDPGEIPLPQNLSNLMRIALLYKYGGVYIDTDFIVLKDFRGLKNSIGAQSSDVVSGNWTRLNNAVMVFDKHHLILSMFMEEFAATFNGSRWGHNGPYMVSRVVERVQGEGYGGNLDLTVLPPAAFYPVGWMRIGGLFEGPKTRSGQKWVVAKVAQLKQRSFGVHLWNKQSRGIEIEEGSVMDRLTSEHCVICNRRRRRYSSNSTH